MSCYMEGKAINSDTPSPCRDGCMEYLISCMPVVGCIKSYIVKSLFNAPATFDDYYETKILNDLYGYS